jgi:hypothetical protein
MPARRRGTGRANNQTVAAARAGTDAAVREIEEIYDYKLQFQRFKDFVDGSNELSGTPCYLTRENIDAFFDGDVRYREFGKSAMQKIMPALRWYSLHREHVGAAVPFVVESPITEAALKAQAAYYKSKGGSGKPGQDPHYGLKDNLVTSDRLKIMDFIYRQRARWGPASFTFTWGNNAAIRGASNRKLVYADLRMSLGYGAEEDGKLSRALLVVL